VLEFGYGGRVTVSETLLFTRLPEATRRRLLDNARRMSFPADSFVFHEGQNGDSLYLVESGRVGIFAGGERGDPVLVSIVGPGEVFGELGLLAQDHLRAATAVALEQTQTLHIARQQIVPVLASDPAVPDFLIQMLLQRIHRLTMQVAEMAELDGPTRLFRQLVRLAETYEVSGRDAVIPLSQQNLASVTGLGLRMTNRVLNDARRDGVVTTGKRRIIVHDWDVVRRRAGWRASYSMLRI
jgi:CRP/FNR family transcriptional regulator, cyclic AMP receptor protein